MKKLLYLLLLLAACSTPAADDTPALSNRILLYVDDIPLSEEMYRQHFAQKGYQLPEDKHEQKALQSRIVNEMVNILLMSREAEKQQLAKQPQTKLALEIARQNYLAKALVGEYLAEIEVTDDELAAAYREIEEEAVKRAEYNVAHILLKSQQEAQTVISELESGKDFAAVARASSEDASKSSGGELGWVSASQVEPEFAKALLKLNKDELTIAPVQTKFGWHIIKVRDINRQKVPPLAEIKSKLTELITQRKLMGKIETLRNAATIKKPEDKYQQLPQIK